MALAPGSKLGPYEIVALLGVGGMGEVYRARDTALQRDVAVKILHSNSQRDPDRLRRFRQEAQAAAALAHPNILAIYLVGEHDGVPFLASELLEGESLRERLRSGPILVRKFIEFATQLTDALAAAHEKGIIHRDLKPENIFLTKDGHAKILDFGLAKLLHAEASETQGASLTLTQESVPGAVLGTVGYMSPEQARGQAADPRSDIFSLGVIFYEMLSGKNAFQRGTTADTLSAILREDPPELLQTISGVSPALDRIVRRCMEKKPADRFQSVRDLGFALLAISGVGSSSHSGSIVIPPKKSKSVQNVGVAALALATLFLAYFVGRRMSAPAPVTLPAFQQLTFRRGMVQSARFTPDGQTIVYGASFDGQPKQIYTTRPGSPESLPLGADHTIPLGIGSSNELAVSVGCQGYFMAYCVGTLARMPLSGGAPREIAEQVLAADWLPDGKEIAAVRTRGGHVVLEYPLGKVIYETIGWLADLRISPDGNFLALAEHPEVGNDAGSVLVLDTQAHRIVASDFMNSLEGMAWSPSGKEVWFAASTENEGWADQIRALDLSGKQRTLLRLPGITRLLDISRDGRVLISSDRWRATLAFRGLKDTRERDLSWFDYSLLTDMTPDGKTVIFCESGSSSASTYFLYLRKTDGSPALRLGEGEFGAISPDEKWVLTVNGVSTSKLAMLPVGSGEIRYLPDSGLKHFASPGWSPDGNQVVYAANDGLGWRIYTQDLEGGKARAFTPELSTSPDFLASRLVSPDGKYAWARDLQGKSWLFPIDGSPPIGIAGLVAGDHWANWGVDSRTAYIYSMNANTNYPLKIYRLDPFTGNRKLLRDITPEDAVGLGIPFSVRISLDEQSYAHSYERSVCELFVVSGLK
jgi:serine/threonine protein kinase/WD40 repeat protein